jgi:hypothetical protein
MNENSIMRKILYCLLPVILLCLVMVRNTPILGAIGLPVIVLWLVNVLLVSTSPKVVRVSRQFADPHPGSAGLTTLGPTTFHASSPGGNDQHIP